MTPIFLRKINYEVWLEMVCMQAAKTGLVYISKNLWWKRLAFKCFTFRAKKIIITRLT